MQNSQTINDNFLILSPPPFLKKNPVPLPYGQWILELKREFMNKLTMHLVHLQRLGSCWTRYGNITIQLVGIINIVHINLLNIPCCEWRKENYLFPIWQFYPLKGQTPDPYAMNVTILVEALMDIIHVHVAHTLFISNYWRKIRFNKMQNDFVWLFSYPVNNFNRRLFCWTWSCA